MIPDTKMTMAALLCSALCAPRAAAQFPGDIYLEEANSLVAEQGEVTVRVLTFTGTKRFGAARYELTYDPAVLRFVDATLPPESKLVVSSSPSAGRIGLLSANARGVDRPFGVVTIAELKFRAVGLAGAQSLLDLSAFRQIALDRSNVATNTFDGSVTVTSAQPAMLEPESGTARQPRIVASSEPVVPNRDERALASRCGRPGDRVWVWRVVPHAGCLMGLRVPVVVAPVPGPIGDAPSPDSAKR